MTSRRWEGVKDAGETDICPCTIVAIGTLLMGVLAAVMPATGIMTAAALIEDSTLDQGT